MLTRFYIDLKWWPICLRKHSRQVSLWLDKKVPSRKIPNWIVDGHQRPITKVTLSICAQVSKKTMHKLWYFIHQRPLLFCWEPKYKIQQNKKENKSKRYEFTMSMKYIFHKSSFKKCKHQRTTENSLWTIETMFNGLH